MFQKGKLATNQEQNRKPPEQRKTKHNVSSEASEISFLRHCGLVCSVNSDKLSLYERL